MVEAQLGKKIPGEVTDMLIAKAQDMIAALNVGTRAPAHLPVKIYNIQLLRCFCLSQIVL